MRVLITGSRDWQDAGAVERELHGLLHRSGVTSCEGGPTFVVVHGACPTGADAMARGWAESVAEVWPDVSHEPHPASWDLHGRAAGPRRNREMVTAGADVCLAFIRDRSPGATGCARLALDAGIELHVWRES